MQNTGIKCLQIRTSALNYYESQPQAAEGLISESIRVCGRERSQEEGGKNLKLGGRENFQKWGDANGAKIGVFLMQMLQGFLADDASDALVFERSLCR